MRSDEAKALILGKYKERFEKHGYTPPTLGWVNEGQNNRFRMFTEIGHMDGCSILDVGCGFGDMAKYLDSHGYNVDYTGIDLNPDFIEYAQKQNPSHKFILGDMESHMGSYDWVFACGVFEFKESLTYMKSLIKKMYLLCKKGMVVDFLSTTSDKRNPKALYIDPESMHGWWDIACSDVVIRDEYMKHEFCMYLYKEKP